MEKSTKFGIRRFKLYKLSKLVEISKAPILPSTHLLFPILSFSRSRYVLMLE